ncbi:hypothetical protein MMC30_004630 [Trapelia coarctata]|nr:hypothetical protein [Trapelia coarctata]
MGRPKRAASQADATASDPPAKKGRNKDKATPAVGRPKRTSAAEASPLVTKKNGKEVPTTAAAGRSRRPPVKEEEAPTLVPKDSKGVVKSKESKPAKASELSVLPKASKASKASKATKPASNFAPGSKAGKNPNAQRDSIVLVEVPVANHGKKRGKEVSDHEAEEAVDDEATQKQYWLMKAEPESRMEKGKDVKFSIDDLAVRTEPEAWDGVRNLTARNNIRAMMKGDLAFFYHSNCKVPGIAGIMEIVREHSVDESAFDEDHPYYDKKSDREKPKWFVVHVEFRHKFKELVRLKDLQIFSKAGGLLENLQTIKQSRLSVSKVSKKEWDFILGLAEIGLSSDTTAPVTKTAIKNEALDAEPGSPNPRD